MKTSGFIKNIIIYITSFVIFSFASYAQAEITSPEIKQIQKKIKQLKRTLSLFGCSYIPERAWGEVASNIKCTKPLLKLSKAILAENKAKRRVAAETARQRAADKTAKKIIKAKRKANAVNINTTSNLKTNSTTKPDSKNNSQNTLTGQHEGQEVKFIPNQQNLPNALESLLSLPSVCEHTIKLVNNIPRIDVSMQIQLMQAHLDLAKENKKINLISEWSLEKITKILGIAYNIQNIVSTNYSKIEQMTNDIDRIQKILIDLNLGIKQDSLIEIFNQIKNYCNDKNDKDRVQYIKRIMRFYTHSLHIAANDLAVGKYTHTNKNLINYSIPIVFTNASKELIYELNIECPISTINLITETDIDQINEYLNQCKELIEYNYSLKMNKIQDWFDEWSEGIENPEATYHLFNIFNTNKHKQEPEYSETLRNIISTIKEFHTKCVQVIFNKTNKYYYEQKDNIASFAENEDSRINKDNIKTIVSTLNNNACFAEWIEQYALLKKHKNLFDQLKAATVINNKNAPCRQRLQKSLNLIKVNKQDISEQDYLFFEKCTNSHTQKQVCCAHSINQCEATKSYQDVFSKTCINQPRALTQILDGFSQACNNNSGLCEASCNAGVTKFKESFLKCFFLPNFKLASRIFHNKNPEETGVQNLIKTIKNTYDKSKVKYPEKLNNNNKNQKLKRNHQLSFKSTGSDIATCNSDNEKFKKSGIKFTAAFASGLCKNAQTNDASSKKSSFTSNAVNAVDGTFSAWANTIDDSNSENIVTDDFGAKPLANFTDPPPIPTASPENLLVAKNIDVTKELGTTAKDKKDQAKDAEKVTKLNPDSKNTNDTKFDINNSLGTNLLTASSKITTKTRRTISSTLVNNKGSIGLFSAIVESLTQQISPSRWMRSIKKISFKKAYRLVAKIFTNKNSPFRLKWKLSKSNKNLLKRSTYLIKFFCNNHSCS